MNTFDDFFADRSADSADSADELEQALRDTLLRRESDISAGAPLLEGPSLFKNSQLRKADLAPGGRRVTLLAAAVVLVLCGATALGVDTLARRHSNGSVAPANHSTPVPKPTPSPTAKAGKAANACPVPQSWLAAIQQAAVVPVDQPLNDPESSGPNGTFLMLQSAADQGGLSHEELAVFDAQGHGSTIWTAADPDHDLVTVSPDSAISANWVVYGLTRSQNIEDHGVRAWSRQDGSTVDVRTTTTAEESAGIVIDISPIVVGDTAYWVEHQFRDTTHETLVSQQLPSGARSSRPVSGVERLVGIGGGVAVIGGADLPPGHVFGEPEHLVFGQGIIIPPAVLSAAATGRMFGSDGDTLHWLSGSGAAGQLNSWTSGQPKVVQTPAAYAGPAWQARGPFLVGADAGNEGTELVLDTRSGRQVQLPLGWAFSLITGDQLIVATGSTKSGAADIHRVNVNSLKPATC